MGNSPTRRTLRKYQLFGLTGLILLFGSLGAWGSLSNIQGAVIAPGVIVVESYVKRVQHREGGIVGEIRVREGDPVKAGEMLLKLDETETRAELEILQSVLDEFEAKRARLIAERDGEDKIVFPESLLSRKDDAAIASMIVGQERLFTTQKASLDGRKEQLNERVGQLEEQITGLHAQVDSKKEQSRLIKDEHKNLKMLQEQGLVPVSRVLALEREAARLDGESGQLVGDIAAAKGRIVETRLQIIQLEDDARTRTLSELREAEARISEVQERRIAAQAKLSRTVIKAPIDGIVHQLAVHTIGGVIAPGETVMQIVPDLDELVIEAHVTPQDIDQVHVTQKAQVRFPAFSQRTTPEVFGEVIHVSADLTRPDAHTPPYFVIRIRLTQDELNRLGDVKLKPGMPAESFIQTGERRPLDYLLQPFTDQIARTFREG